MTFWNPMGRRKLHGQNCGRIELIRLGSVTERLVSAPSAEWSRGRSQPARSNQKERSRRGSRLSEAISEESLAGSMGAEREHPEAVQVKPPPCHGLLSLRSDSF